MKKLLQSETLKTVILTIIVILSVETIGMTAAYEMGALDPYLSGEARKNPPVTEE